MSIANIITLVRLFWIADISSNAPLQSILFLWYSLICHPACLTSWSYFLVIISVPTCAIPLLQSWWLFINAVLFECLLRLDGIKCFLIVYECHVNNYYEGIGLSKYQMWYAEIAVQFVISSTIEFNNSFFCYSSFCLVGKSFEALIVIKANANITFNVKSLLAKFSNMLRQNTKSGQICWTTV